MNVLVFKTRILCMTFMIFVSVIAFQSCENTSTLNFNIFLGESNLRESEEKKRLVLFVIFGEKKYGKYTTVIQKICYIGA